MQDEPTTADTQVELTFHLGGKLLKSWTTADLVRLGAMTYHKEEGGGMRAEFHVVGCEQILGTNQYVFTLSLANGKKVSFDILTGEVRPQ